MLGSLLGGGLGQPSTSAMRTTFNGNPMTMEAGIAVMSNLNQPDFDYMNSLGEKLRQRLRSVFDEINLGAQVTGYGSLFGINFNNQKIVDYRTFIENDSGMTKILFTYLRIR